MGAGTRNKGHGNKQLSNAASYFSPDSRCGKRRIANLCSPFRNNEAELKDKQDRMIVFFLAPKPQTHLSATVAAQIEIAKTA
jgi:hypothetical protein